MVNQLRQVLRTYTTRWLFWAIVAYWALQHGLVVLASIFEPLASRADQFGMMMMTLMGTYALGAMVGSLLSSSLPTRAPGWSPALPRLT
jgi:hypothetical protein